MIPNDDVTPRAWRTAHAAIVGLVAICTGLVSYQTVQINAQSRQIMELQAQVTELKIANASPRIGPNDVLAIYNAINVSQQNAVRMQSAIEYNTKQIDDLQKRVKP